MGTLLWVGWTNLRRDRVAQMLTFLLPIVFFSIFANVFGGQGDVSTARIRIAVVDEDHSEVSARLIEGLKNEKGLRAQMTADGSQVFFLRDLRGAHQLFRAAVQGEGSLGPPAPVFPGTGAPNVRSFDVSPDGRLLAFTTDNVDSPLRNVVVTTLPDSRERRQVTASGRERPRFSRDGRELYSCRRNALVPDPLAVS